MFAKHIFFIGLMMSFSSIFVFIKSSDASDSDFTQNYDSTYASSKNKQNKSVTKSSFSQTLTEDERNCFIRRFLFDYRIYAPEHLIKSIVELTDGYDNTQITELLVDLLSLVEKEEEEDERKFEYVACLEKLKEIIVRIDTGQIKRQKLEQVRALIFMSAPLFNFEWSLKENAKRIGFDTVLPTAEERLEILKEILLEHRKSASEFEMQMIVERTSGYDIDSYKNWVINKVKKTKSGSLDQERLLDYPAFFERYEVIEEILLIANKSASGSLMQNIVKLTSGYDMQTITELINRMVKESKTNFLDRSNCLAILKKATDSIKEDRFRKYMFEEVEAVISEDDL